MIIFQGRWQLVQTDMSRIMDMLPLKTDLGVSVDYFWAGNDPLSPHREANEREWMNGKHHSPAVKDILWDAISNSGHQTVTEK